MEKEDNTFNLVINHIALYVSDLVKSNHFYEKVMGFKNIPEPFKDGKHSWFEIGNNCHLHLIEGSKEIIKHHINTHLAFTTASIDSFVETLTNAGITFRDPINGQLNVVHIRPDGIKQVFFQDPDGYWLEVNNDV